jgi:AraC-like DNA-binding protein
MLALVRAGHAGFLDAREERFEARVRALVSEAPARPWSSAMLERLLHVSGATLRRKLAAEGTSLREVVTEARLHHAVALLQTRPLPLKTVAAQSGYRSVQAFSRQFEARFGVDPMTVKR